MTQTDREYAQALYRREMREWTRMGTGRYEVHIFGATTEATTEDEVREEIRANRECLGYEGESNFVLDHQERTLHYI
jgi:hypothetical protein